MMEVLISNRQSAVKIDSGLVKKIGLFVLDCLGTASTELSISFVSEEESQQLNKAYRNKKKKAEVLSFPMDEKDLIGDVVIAPSISEAKARSEGVAFYDRIAYMMIHGVLHLSGKTHNDGENALEMEKLEAKILGGLKKEGIL